MISDDVIAAQREAEIEQSDIYDAEVDSNDAADKVSLNFTVFC